MVPVVNLKKKLVSYLFKVVKAVLTTVCHFLLKNEDIILLQLNSQGIHRDIEASMTPLCLCNGCSLWEELKVLVGNIVEKQLVFQRGTVLPKWELGAKPPGYTPSLFFLICDFIILFII